MADVHNEDMILSLNTALSSVREALDTTVKIEQASSMSSGDRVINVNIIKAAITNVLTILQNCGSARYEGTSAPDHHLSALRIDNLGEIVAVGTEASTAVAKADFIDHHGRPTSTDQLVDVTWLSSDSGIISINSSTGVYLALIPGTVTITARHGAGAVASVDRKSTRLNSSHLSRSRMPSSA